MEQLKTKIDKLLKRYKVPRQDYWASVDTDDEGKECVEAVIKLDRFCISSRFYSEDKAEERIQQLSETARQLCDFNEIKKIGNGHVYRDLSDKFEKGPFGVTTSDPIFNPSGMMSFDHTHFPERFKATMHQGVCLDEELKKFLDDHNYVYFSTDEDRYNKMKNIFIQISDKCYLHWHVKQHHVYNEREDWGGRHNDDQDVMTTEDLIIFLSLMAKYVPSEKLDLLSGHTYTVFRQNVFFYILSGALTGGVEIFAQSDIHYSADRNVVEINIKSDLGLFMTFRIYRITQLRKIVENEELISKCAKQIKLPEGAYITPSTYYKHPLESGVMHRYD